MDIGGGSTTTRAARATGVPARVVPTIVFHGDRDLTVNVVNADHVLARWVDSSNGGDTTTGRDISKLKTPDDILREAKEKDAAAKAATK